MRSCTLRFLVLFIILSWLLAQRPLSVQADDEPKLEKPSKIHEPLRVPDRIVLTWTASPATTQAVTWRTDNDVDVGLAEVAPASDGPDFVARARRVRARTVKLKADLETAHYHSAVFRDLSPASQYLYRVGDGKNWSEWAMFRTAALTPEPFSFVYFGDAQNQIKSMWSRVVRASYRESPNAAFMLHAGDLVNSPNKDADWGEWFYAGGHIHRTVPAIASPGNHEYATRGDGDNEYEELSRHWRPTFAFPENGPEGLKETAYFIDYQGARIVSLDSNIKHREQAIWLDRVLSTNPQRWTIIAFHHPLYSSKAGRDNSEIRKIWQPVFDKHKVDIVLQGHDHTYARTRLMRFENLTAGVSVRDDSAGTMYVVSVSGPKMYDLGRRPFMVRVAEDTQLFQVITVDGDELRYEARTATGRLYDAFTLQKRSGQPNRLIDQIPPTPERKRPPKAD